MQLVNLQLSEDAWRVSTLCIKAMRKLQTSQYLYTLLEAACGMQCGAAELRTVTMQGHRDPVTMIRKPRYRALHSLASR